MKPGSSAAGLNRPLPISTVTSRDAATKTFGCSLPEIGLPYLSQDAHCIPASLHLLAAHAREKDAALAHGQSCLGVLHPCNQCQPWCLVSRQVLSK